MSACICGKTANPLTSPAESVFFWDRATANVTSPNGQMEMHGSPQRNDSATAVRR